MDEDPTINDSTLTTFGDATFDDWRSLATKLITGGTRKIEPSLTGGACNKADPNNWGSPLAPTGACGGYFPIVWVEVNLAINGVHGQGVLLVNGDLDVQGGFEFFGPVLVKGRLSTQGTGGHFNGGVIAANVDLEQNTVLGNAVISYSSCALAKALTNSAPAAPGRVCRNSLHDVQRSPKLQSGAVCACVPRQKSGDDSRLDLLRLPMPTGKSRAIGGR